MQLASVIESKQDSKGWVFKVMVNGYQQALTRIFENVRPQEMMPIAYGFSQNWSESTKGFTSEARLVGGLNGLHRLSDAATNSLGSFCVEGLGTSLDKSRLGGLLPKKEQQQVVRSRRWPRSALPRANFVPPVQWGGDFSTTQYIWG